MSNHSETGGAHGYYQYDFREMQGRIVELIGRINHDEITAELLRLNDELNNLFLRHQRYEKNRDPQNVGSATPASILGAAMGVPQLDQGKYCT